MADAGFTRNEIRIIVDPLLMKLREELMGSGHSFGRLWTGALPPSTVVVGGDNGTTDPDSLGYIKGIAIYSGGTLIASNRKELSFLGAGISSTGDRATIDYATPLSQKITNPLTTAGDILYALTGGTPTRRAIGTDGQYLSVVAGLPEWVTISGVSTSGFINPMTTRGDMIYGEVDGEAYRLAIGTSGQVLTVSGGIPVWQTITTTGSGISDPTTTLGDMIYRDSTELVRLPIGAEGQILSVSGNVPTWQTFDSLIPSGSDFLYAHTDTVAKSLSGNIYGPLFKLTEPVDSGFAWINQGSSTISTSEGGIYLESPTSGSLNMSIRKKTAPSTPYTVTALLALNARNEGFIGFGLCWRESSSGKIVAHLMQMDAGSPTGIYWVPRKLNDATTFSANYAVEAAPFWPMIWLQISDDGTNRKMRYSADGIHFQQIHSVGRTDFMTADEVGFFVNPQGAAISTGIWVISWKES